LEIDQDIIQKVIVSHFTSNIRDDKNATPIGDRIIAKVYSINRYANESAGAPSPAINIRERELSRHRELPDPLDDLTITAEKVCMVRERKKK